MTTKFLHHVLISIDVGWSEVNLHNVPIGSLDLPATIFVIGDIPAYEITGSLRDLQAEGPSSCCHFSFSFVWDLLEVLVPEQRLLSPTNLQSLWAISAH